MNKPLVSVCCITYNHEKYIKDCLQGFLNQETNFDIEFLLHDDASTDNTQRIIKDLVGHDLRFNLILRKVNIKSTGKAIFPILFEKAKGKHIAMCEGDDYWTDPLKLQKQVDFLEANQDFSGVFHNVGFIDERKENQKITPWRTYNQDVFTARDTIRKLSLFHTSSYCFRNIKFDKSLLLNPKVKSGDMLLLGLIAKHGKLKLLDEMMSVYRKNDGGVTSNETQIEYHKNRVALNKTLDAYFDFKYKAHAKNIIDYHIREIKKIKYPKLFKFKNQLKRLKS